MVMFSAPDSKETPPALSPMKDVTVLEGSPAQFRSKITGTPTPRVQWLRDGALIPQSADFQVHTDIFSPCHKTNFHQLKFNKTTTISVYIN